jgi:hypothetical protein
MELSVSLDLTFAGIILQPESKQSRNLNPIEEVGYCG